MTDTPPYGDGSVEELAAVADELKEALDGLTESVGIWSEKTNTNQRVIAAIGTFAVLKLITIVVLIVIIVNLVHTNHKLEASVRQTAATQQEQTVIRNQTLCPLYAFVLTTTADPATRASVPASQRKAFDAEIKVFNDGYAALKCT